MNSLALRPGTRGAVFRTFGATPLALAAYGAFALSDAAVRTLDGTLNPFQIAFTGALVGLLGLPLLGLSGDRIGDIFVVQCRSLWLARAVVGAISCTASVIAFSRLSMPEAFSLIFLAPLFVTALSALFLHEDIGPWRWAAVLLGMAGVMLVLRPGVHPLGVGHAAGLVCALASAIVIVLFRAGGSDEKRISMLGSGLFGTLAITGPLMFTEAQRPTGVQAGLLLGYGALALLGQLLLVLAAQRIPASRLAPTQYSQMIWAAALSYILFDQPLDLVACAGIAVIIGAGMTTWMREQIQMPSWRRRLGLRPR